MDKQHFIKLKSKTAIEKYVVYSTQVHFFCNYSLLIHIIVLKSTDCDEKQRRFFHNSLSKLYKAGSEVHILI